jgi:uncharacterized protein
MTFLIIMTFLILTILFLLVDYYLFQAVIIVSKDWATTWKNGIRIGFWIPTVLAICALVWWFFGDPYQYRAEVRTWIVTALFATYFSKLFGVKYLVNYFSSDNTEALPGKAIPRSEFLAKTALIAASVPLGTMAYGIISGAHDYRVRKISVKLPNLPKSFDGFKIGQISDIHSGSFFNKTAVKGGVEMLLKEKPDAIFFTGDLVNNESSEVKDYIWSVLCYRKSRLWRLSSLEIN